MKEPNTMFNTHILTVKGLFTDNSWLPFKVNVDIRCTSDKRGETLSLTVGDIQIAVKVKDIEKIIAEARGSLA